MRIETLTKDAADRYLHGRRRNDQAADRIATRICAEVQNAGDRAVLFWARRLDGARAASVAGLRLRSAQISRRAAQVGREEMRMMESAANNIRKVAERQLPSSWRLRVAPGVCVTQLVRPLDVVACYVPGGRYPLVSTLLMTAIPAQVAGVQRIVVTCPQPSAAILAAAKMLGLGEIYELGGAQAIAAFAYGTKTLPRADMICGPGNRFVTAAKHYVSRACRIDMLAGPTELLVMGDSGDPRFVAADMIAQAEHDPDAVVALVTTSKDFARSVRAEAIRQLQVLRRNNPAHRALASHGRIWIAPSRERAQAFVNAMAPEHLSLAGRSNQMLKHLHAAGSIFLGPWSAQPFGDYATGSNHVLPTGGWGRRRGGLSAADFVRCVSVQRVTRAGLRTLAPVAGTLARLEGLVAHERAVAVRTSGWARHRERE
jgi:histidinol dehydrogenase